MGKFKGKLKYNASSLAGGELSNFGSASTQDFSFQESNKYLLGSNNGINILAKGAKGQDSICGAQLSGTLTTFGSDIGSAYDGTNTSNTNEFYLTSTGNVLSFISNVWANLGVIIANSATSGGIWTHVNNLGVEKVFVSGNSGANWLINTFNRDGTGNANVFSVAQVDVDAPHRGVSGLLNRSYITNGRYVATYEPVSNTFNATKLNLGVGWITTSIRQYGNYMAITGYKSNGSSRLWLWDGAAEFPNFQYEINDQYATCFVDGVNLYIFSSGRNQTTKLYIFNNQDISGKPIWQTYDQNKLLVPEQGSICSFADNIHWRGNNGTMYCYGEYKGTYGVHKPFSLDNLSIVNANIIGVCRALYGAYLVVPRTVGGGQNTSLSRYDIFQDPGNTGTYELLFPSVTLPHDTTLEYIKVIFNKFANTNSFINFYYNDTVNNQGPSPSNGELRVRFSDLSPAGIVTADYRYHVFNKFKIPKLDILSLGYFSQNCSIREIEIGYTYQELSL